MSRILMRRGNKADLPTLAAGEPGVALDTKQVFAGTNSGNIALPSVLSGGFKIQSGSGSLTYTQATQATATVTFPTSFAAGPVNAVVGLATGFTNGNNAYISAANPNVNGFTVAFQTSGASGSVSYVWIATGG